MNEKFKEVLKKPWPWLVGCLGLCLVNSAAAGLVNNAGFSYTVKQVTADIDNLYEGAAGSTVISYRKALGDVDAKLTGNLYLPKGVSSTNPRPCVILTHGYLNSKEFQEAPAIEMARRGYVVFAFDQYDHGDSTWKTPAQFNFYVWSAYDAVQYMYAQDYVLKDAAGNGMISVSGHSMGGFSSELAVAWDEMSTAMFGIQSFRKIAACLAVGADFRYDDGYVNGYSGGTYAKTYMTYNTRSCGTLYGEYDEFFFDNDSAQNTAGNTVTKKDYAKDSVGYSMLGYTAANKNLAKNDEWTKVDPDTNLVTDATTGYGERILLKVSGDHPYNTWSPEATGKMIEFYDHAFNYQLTSHSLNPTASYGIKNLKGQIWWLKEVFTCLNLFAFVGALIAGVFCLVDLPFLRKVKTAPEDIPELGPVTPARKGIGLAVTGFSLLLSMWLIPALMNRSTTDLELVAKISKYVLIGALLVLLVMGVVWAFVKHKEGEVEEKVKHQVGRFAVAATLLGLLSLVTKWVVTDGTTFITKGAQYWSAPSINTIVYWAVASGLIGLLFTLVNYFFVNEDRTIAHLGLKANIAQVGLALLIAVTAAVAGWVCLEFSIWVFGVDFRVYTYAFNGVTWTQFVAALKYMPLFFIFYLCAGLGVANATAGKKGIVADLIAVAIEVIPCALFLFVQYGRLLATGTAAWPSFALNGILVQGLILTLFFLAVIQRRTLAKTGNIWTGVFLNTIWFTMITLASTTVYQLA